MNKPLLSVLVAITTSSVLLLSGCQSTPESEQAQAPVEDATAKPATPPDSGIGKPESGVGTGTPLGSRDPTRDPSNILSKRSVYFDFDSNAVKDEFRPIVQAHGTYLRDNAARKVVIQGNTDERGSREYNLALGQRRADAVKQMMLLVGARESQVESVSFGKEKPRNPGHDEAAWAENRRADIVYNGE